MQTLPELSVRRLMVPDPIAVTPEEPVQSVLRLMNDLKIGAVLVTDGPQLLGIFTERDLLRQAATAAAGWRDTPIENWMTADPHTIGPDVDWEVAFARMKTLGVRHLPVIDSGEVIGILSSRSMFAWQGAFLAQEVAERTDELRRANAELLARDAELTHNLRLASRLMERIVLPSGPPRWDELSFAVEFHPLDPLGGDYYDFAYPDADHLGVLIADASGHSLAAAMVAIMARIAFSAVAGKTPRPGEVLAAMNARLQGLSDERFVTAFYGVLDRKTRVLTYANAGHPQPLLQRAATGHTAHLPGRGFMLGILPDEVYREQQVALEPGDRLVLFTDGVVESQNETGELLGARRWTGMVQERHGEAFDGLCRRLLGDVRRFRAGAKAGDDLTLMTLGVPG